MITRIVIIVLSVVLFSCQEGKTKFTSEESFDSYINDPVNGFIQSKPSNELRFDVKLTPPISNEKNSQITMQLRISREDQGSVLKTGEVTDSEISSIENYLSFELSSDVYLESGSTTVPVAFHHYERNYGLKPSIDILFNFKAFNVTEDVYFVYRDDIFNQGLIKIKFKKELFNNCYVQK